MSKAKNQAAKTSIAAAALAAASSGQSLTPPSAAGSVVDLLSVLNNKDAVFCRESLVEVFAAEAQVGKKSEIWAQGVFDQGIRSIMLENTDANKVIREALKEAFKDVVAAAKYSGRELELYRMGTAEAKKLAPETKALRETLIKRVNAAYAYALTALKAVEKKADQQFLIAQGGTAAITEQAGNGEAAGGTVKGTRNLGERVKEQFSKWTNAINKLESKSAVESEFLAMMVSWEKKLQFLTSK